MQNLIFLTIAANWPKIRRIEKNWVPINWKLSQLSAELNRFELRPLRAEIFNDKVVRIIINKTLVKEFPSIQFDFIKNSKFVLGKSKAEFKA